jgi:hypothetical protein
MQGKSDEVAVFLDCGSGSNERLEGDELGGNGSGEECDRESESKDEWDALCLSIHESASLFRHRIPQIPESREPEVIFWIAADDVRTRAQFRHGLSISC